MLTDATVERYSRQILLEEVGGRGQARLLDATVHVDGGGAAAVVAIDLLERAGVRVERGAAPRTGAPRAMLPGGVTVVSHWTDDGVRIATVARPLCPTCRAGGSSPTPSAAPTRPDSAATDQVVGALVAGECLRALLGLAPRERALRVDLDASRCEPTLLSSTTGCPACTDLS